MSRAMDASGLQNHGTSMQTQESRRQSYPLPDFRPGAQLQHQPFSGERNHFSCVLMGAGSLLMRCGELWLAHEYVITAVVSSDPTIVEWARGHGLVVLEQLSGLHQLAKAQGFDYLYSIANLRIMPDEVLALPRCAAINFHDSLLPAYAGVHVTSWALLEQQKVHGVTWHLMQSSVDQGPIIKQQRLEIAADETALSLNLKCYEAGFTTFAELLGDLATGRLVSVPQNLNHCTYYARYKRPAMGCLFQWDWPADSILALIRALDFGPYDNPLGCAKFAVGDRLVLALAGKLLDSGSNQAPGTLVDLAEGLRVATSDGDVCITHIASLDGEVQPPTELAAACGLRLGDIVGRVTSETGQRIELLYNLTCKAEAFWRQRLITANPVTAPYRNPAALPTGNMASLRFALPTTPRQTLAGNASNVLFTACAAFLARLSGNTDIGFSDTTLQKTLAGTSGMFAAHVPFRMTARTDLGLIALASIVEGELDLVRRKLTFPKDLKFRYAAVREHSQTTGPIYFPVVLELVTTLAEHCWTGDAEWALVVTEQGGALCYYDRGLVSDAAVTRAVEQLQVFVQAALEQPHQPIQNLPWLSDLERYQILELWNQTAVDYPCQLTLCHLFEQQASNRPQAVAAACADSEITYLELSRRSNQLAAFLRARGVGPGTFVAILLERSVDLLTGLLGVLKTGAAYVPLDPYFPEDRLSFMLGDSGATWLLTQSSLAASLLQATPHHLLLDQHWSHIDAGDAVTEVNEAAAEQPAYLIYTSGSTGKPKGVLIGHRALTNLLCSMAEKPGFSCADVLLAVTTICFDIAALELYLPLITGGRVEILPDKASGDGAQLSTSVNHPDITVLQATPATWQLLLAAGWTGNPKLKMLCGGEALGQDLARQLLDLGSELWNLFGPTETTIWSSVAQVLDSSAVSIGRPIANTRFYILDEHQAPCPIGVAGELYIGGDGLAFGYHNRPQLTQERFVTTHFNPNERLYRTGDLVRYYADGEVEYLGRLDQQVKLRGYRIELGEIEATLQQAEAIGEAVVVKRDDGAGIQYLAAFLIADRSASTATLSEDWSVFLGYWLPAYMIPARYIWLQHYPLTLNRKIDRRLLSNETIDTIHTRFGTSAERDPDVSLIGDETQLSDSQSLPLAQRLADDLLGIAADLVRRGAHDIDRTHPLGRYGFDSIRFTAFSAKLESRFGITVGVPLFYQYTTIVELANYLADIHGPVFEHHYATMSAVSELSASSSSALASSTWEKKKDEMARSPQPSVDTVGLTNTSMTVPSTSADHRSAKAAPAGANDIAVIGMAGIMPQSPDLQTYWTHLMAGHDLVTEIPQDRRSRYQVENSSEDGNGNHLHWGGFIGDMSHFDAAFFHISPLEAEQMDPRQRLFLQLAWHALEDAGYPPSSLAGSDTGVFVGVTAEDYLQLMLRSGSAPNVYSLSGMRPAIIANRVSHYFNFHGPSTIVDATCSSSLVAVCQAIEHLLAGHCGMAIAGGINLLLSPATHAMIAQNGMLSPTHRCKTFDQSADGYVRGEGLGAVILKPLAQAQADGDLVYAVIKGWAENHDGRSTSLPAPNPVAQAALVVQAHQQAGIDPTTVGYIEVHGSATALGDPIEINGLKMAFERLYSQWGHPPPRAPHCGLGAVKTNVGHLEAAAGMAGLLKVLLALRHGKLPPNLHLSELNPDIQLTGSPFYPLDHPQAWEPVQDSTGAPMPRRAGISSFGFGGTNAHLVLEEYQAEQPPTTLPSETQLLLLSAHNQTALHAYALSLLAFIKQPESFASPTGPGSLAALAATFQLEREAMQERLAILTTSLDELAEQLTRFSAGQIHISGLYTGNARQQQSTVELLSTGPGRQDFVAGLIRDRDLDKLAQLWVVGTPIDWHLLHGDARQRYYALPLTYPFCGQHFWLSDAAEDIPEARIPQDSLTEATPQPEVADIEVEGTHTESLQALFTRLVANCLKVEQSSLEPNTPLSDLGFDSLTIMELLKQLRHHLGTDLSYRALLGLNTITQLTAYFTEVGGIEASPAATLPAANALQPPNLFPVAEAQQALWLLYRLTSEMYAYNAPFAYWITSPFDSDALERACRALWQRHAVLRSVFCERDDQCYQAFTATHDDFFRRCRLTELHDEAILKMVQETARAPLDLVKGPAARITLFELANGRHLLLFTFHHIIIDGTSVLLILRDLQRCYRAEVDTIPLPQASTLVSYPDFVAWQQQMLAGEAGQLGRQYWLQQLQDCLAPVALPPDQSPPAVPAYRGISLIETLDETTLDELVGLARAQQCSLFTLLFTAFNLLLYQYTSETDLLVGTPMANRTEERFANLVGYMMNMVVLRTTISDDPELGILLGRVQDNVVTAMQYGYYPLFTLCRDLARRGADNNAVPFRMAFYFHLFNDETGPDERLRLEPIPEIHQEGEFDFVLEVVKRPGRCLLYYKYNQDLYHSTTVRRFAASYRQILQAFCRHPAHRVSEIASLATPEPQPFRSTDLEPHPPQAQSATLEALIRLVEGQIPMPEAAQVQHFQRAYKEMEQLGCHLLVASLRRMGAFAVSGIRYRLTDLTRELGVVAAYERLFDALMDILARAGFIRRYQEYIETTSALDNLYDAEELARLEQGLLAADSEVAAYMPLLGACLRAYPEVLTGRLDHIQVMFPDGSLSLVRDIYQGSSITKYYNQVLAELVTVFARSVPNTGKVRILEVGAGTGGTSAFVLPALTPLAHRVEYTYTDISSGFTQHGSRQFGNTYPFVTFSRLNIERQPATQGFETGSYDVVFGTNVVHATRNIVQTLAQLTSLLKPGGLLLLNETVRRQDFFTLTFGLTSGWWLYEDQAYRIPGSPLLQLDTWCHVLEDAGLTGVKSIMPARLSGLDQAIVLGVLDPVAAQPRPRIASPSQTTTGDNEPQQTADDRLRQALEGDLAVLLADLLHLEPASLDPTLNMGAYGIDSIRFTTLSLRLNQRFGLSTDPAMFYKYFTIRAIATYLADACRAVVSQHYPESQPTTNVADCQSPSTATQPPPSATPAHPSSLQLSEARSASEPVAIIGISGRMPQSPDLDSFWAHLVAGTDLVTEIPAERWDASEFFGEPTQDRHKTNTRWGGFMSDIDCFDAAFFGISPREANLMDPRQRLFLQTVWTAVEDAGYAASDLAGSNTGVFVGVVGDDYGDLQTHTNTAYDGYSLSGTAPSIIANRISFLLDLRGPSAPIDTACSSSLVAVHRAVAAIRHGECDLAIAGGVNLMLNPNINLALGQNGMMSSTGRCQTFDQSADGYVRGEGVAAIVLKPLHRARADGDVIHALITGSAENHGGRSNSLTAPSQDAQAAALLTAYERAGIDPSTITYIEAHGTGTSLGDPIEVNGLKQAFAELYDRWHLNAPEHPHCGLGAIKSNIGHLEAAAGIAGLIKVVLAMRHGRLPGNLHFCTQNPYIKLAGSPFYIVSSTQSWPRLQDPDGRDLPRRAGVSSFGFGGVNAHVVLEEAPPNPSPPDTGEPAVILISARHEAGLQTYVWNLADFIERGLDAVNEPALPGLAQIAYTTQVGRQPMAERLAVIAVDHRDLLAKLRAWLSGECESGYRGTVKPRSETPDLLIGGRAGREFMRILLEDRELERLAQLWAAGVPVDWSALYAGATPGRVPIPTYPFADTRYWLPATGQPGWPVSRVALLDKKPSLTPLIDSNVSTLTEHCYGARFTADSDFLRDHVVDDRHVLPGAVLLEMARMAGELSVGGAPIGCLRNLVWSRPVTLQEAAVQMRIRLTPRNEQIACEIYEKRDADRQVYAQATLEPGRLDLTGQRLDVQAIRQRCPDIMSPADCTRISESRGYQFGPSLRAIQTLQRNGREVLSQLQVPTSSGYNPSAFTLHPALVDGALQSAALGFLPATDPPTHYLPFGIDEIQIFDRLPTSCLAYVTESSAPQTEGLVRLNICLSDMDGTVLVRLNNLMLRAVPPLRNDVQPYFFKTDWEAAPWPAATGDTPTVLVFAAEVTRFAQGIAPMWVTPGQQFRRIDADRFELDPGERSHYQHLFNHLQASNRRPTHILHTWSESGLSSERSGLETQLYTGLYSLLHLCVTYLDTFAAQEVRLLYGFAGTDPQPLGAAVSGFAKTVRREHPRFLIKTVALTQPPVEPQNWASLLHELTPTVDADIEVRFDQDGRWVRRTERFELYAGGEEASPLARDGGTYLITGGLGGLGLLCARYLASCARANLVLSGRSEPGPDDRRAMAELEAMGARLRFIRANLGFRDDVDRLIAETKSIYGQIDGVIHAAGVLADSQVRHKTVEQVAAVLEAKLFGTVFLDKALSGEQLDYFILFSSIAAQWGSYGQADYAFANRFLDAFADYRNSLKASGQRNGKTLSINWPLWRDGGMQVNAATSELLATTMGLQPLPSNLGLKILSQGLCQPLTCFAVLYGTPVIQSLSDAPALQQPDEAVADTQAVTLADTQQVDLADILQADLAGMASKLLSVELELVDADEEFGDYGFDSISFTEFANLINETYRLSLTPAVFFEFQSLRRLASHLMASRAETFRAYYAETTPICESEAHDPPIPLPFVERESHDEVREMAAPAVSLPLGGENHDEVGGAATAEPVAIVGIGAMLPQSKDLDEFWHHLEDGRDLVTEIPAARWDWRQWYGDPATEANRTNIKWGAFLQDIDMFDSSFFGIAPREAALMDPQQRLFLTAVWRTIEDAGHKPSELWGTRTGVFVGVSGAGYHELLNQHGVDIQAQIATGNAHSMVPNRVSFLLNLHGPSEPVDTACSSSLVALHRAVEALGNGSCDLAIAGGVNLMMTPTLYIAFSKGGFLSPDGRCKTFDSQANGYARGEGIGALLLKPLRRALQDGDRVYAVIKGSAVNHGGHANFLTAPNVQSQTDLLLEAYGRAGIDPSSVSYIETHGTGTALGDPAEINGLKNAFGELYARWGKSPPTIPHCGLGSVKTNIGHLELAAGVVGLIKVLLALQHKVLPATVHFQTLNPYIELQGSPFYIVNETRPWQALRDVRGAPLPRRAGISSFGFGGVNAHVVLEEFDEEPVQASLSGPHLVVLSAKTEDRLVAAVRQLVDFLAKHAGDEELNCHPDLAIQMRNELVEMLATILDVTQNEVSAAEELTDFGCDRMTYTLLAARLGQKFGLDIAGPTLAGFSSVDHLVEDLINRYGESLRRVLPAPLHPVTGTPGAGISLTDLAWTLAVGREEMTERLAVVVTQTTELQDKLSAWLSGQREVAHLFRDSVLRLRSNRPQGPLEPPPEDQKTASLMSSNTSFAPQRQALRTEAEMARLAAAWVGGTDIDWPHLYAPIRPRRLSLPTYPFARDSHWVTDLSNRQPLPPSGAPDHNAAGSEPSLTDPTPFAPVSGQADSQPLAFYLPHWRRVEPPRPRREVHGSRMVLIVHTPPCFEMEQILANLHHGDHVVHVCLGIHTQRQSENAWTVGIDDVDACSTVVAEIERIDTIYFLGEMALPENGVLDFHQSCAQRGILTLFRLLKALADPLTFQTVALKVITRNLHPVHEDDRVYPFSAELVGMANTLASEYPNLHVCCIDLDLQALGAAPDPVNLRTLLADAVAEPVLPHGNVVAWRHGHRYHRGLVEAKMPTGPGSLFKAGGVYLIVGGAGGIGIALSRHLTATLGAHVILVGRSELDESRRVTLQSIEQCGGTVSYVRADVTDRTAMHQVVATAKSRFGRINGVIHAALVLHDQTLESLDETTLLASLAPKVHGSLVLAEVLAAEPLDFLLFFSSIQALSWSPGQSNYAAACTFQDAFAHYLRAQVNYPVKTINWGYWGEVGIVASPAYRHRLAAKGVQGIDTDAGMVAVAQILACPATQLVVTSSEAQSLTDLGFDPGFEVSWLPQPQEPPRFTAVDAIEIMPLASEQSQRLASAWDALQELGALLVLDAFRRMGVFSTAAEDHDRDILARQLGIIPAYDRLFEALLQCLAESGWLELQPRRIRTTSALDDPEVQATLRTLASRREVLSNAWPELKAHIALLTICCDHYPDLLTGVRSATEVMFPDSSMHLVEGIYQSNVVADYYNRLVLGAVRVYIEAQLPHLRLGQKLRILEVGAGTGATSAVILDGLQDYTDYIEYVYTDISMAFTSYGREQYGKKYACMCFQAFDIEQDIKRQGFHAGTFDLVLATNVLHATKALNAALYNLKSLLAAHGWAILNEVIEVSQFATLTFGLLDGWWHYADAELRLPGAPLLSEPAWCALLRDVGFARIAVLNHPGEPVPSMPQRVLIAESNGQLLTPREVSTVHPTPTSMANALSAVEPPSRVLTAASAVGPLVHDVVISVVAEAIGIERARLQGDVPFVDFGVDSIFAIQIISKINQQLDIQLRTTDLFNFATIHRLCSHIVDQFGDTVVVRQPGATHSNGRSQAVEDVPDSNPALYWLRKLATEDLDIDAVNQVLEDYV